MSKLKQYGWGRKVQLFCPLMGETTTFISSLNNDTPQPSKTAWSN